MAWKITASDKDMEATILLPASKSLSNRALILQQVISQLTHDHLLIKNLSYADDTQIMLNALSTTTGEINIKNAGTCMRFLTAYYAAIPGSAMYLSCDERMKHRPISALVNALNSLGAEITYTEQEGFPPLYIKGKKLTGGNIIIDANETSQFASALMMIAPLMQTPLQLGFRGEVSSFNYIEMTAALMKDFGFEIEMQNDPYANIKITNRLNGLSQKMYEVEADWSSAAFFYEAAALAKSAKIILKGLNLNSKQGDKKMAEWMLALGINTTQIGDDIVLTKSNEPVENKPEVINFKNHPDLAPPFITAVTALGLPYTFIGLESLKVKESNRLAALQQELSNLGYAIKQIGEDTLQTTDQIEVVNLEEILMKTHDDHRLAMAFSLLALRKENVLLSETDSVIKSFPEFWKEVGKLGLMNREVS